MFYRCVFDGLEWQRSMYGHAAVRTVLQGFLDSHLTSAAQLLVLSFCSLLAHLPVLQIALLLFHQSTVMMLEDWGFQAGRLPGGASG